MKKNTIYNMFLTFIAVSIFVLLLNGLLWIELSFLRYWSFENIKPDISMFTVISMVATCLILPFAIAVRVAFGFMNIFGTSNVHKAKGDKNG